MKATWICVARLFALLLGFQQTNAGEVLGLTGQTCYPINFRNTSGTPCISVYGRGIENIDRVTTLVSGVFVSIVGKYDGQQNNSGPFAGSGRVDLAISVSNSTPGVPKVFLINDPISGQREDTFVFGIKIFAPPTVNLSSAEGVAKGPFNNMAVNFFGTGLQGAKTPATGTIIKNDPLIPFVTAGGDADIQSVQILSSTFDQLKAQIVFTALVQDATVELAFRSDDQCVPLGVQPAPSAAFVPFKARVRVRSQDVKNYVKGITFPNGNTFDKNSVGRIVVNLLFPAPQSGGTPIDNANRTVYFKLMPANAFTAVPNGTPYNAAGFTQVNANAGSNNIPISFTVADCLGGQPGTSNTVKIQTWMHNTNSAVAPDFVEQTFQVRCTQ